MKTISHESITADWVRSVLPKRPVDANKGSFGKVLVVGGSVNYIGAAYLAASGAMRVGAGLVRLAAPSGLVPVLAAKLTESTYLPLPEASFGVVSEDAVSVLTLVAGDYDVLLIGCGLGQNESTAAFVKSLLFAQNKLPAAVVDADALNIAAGTPNWWRKLTDNAILTPHPGEMARLAAVSVEKVQSDRSRMAATMAAKWGKIVVLKGAHTVVATPEGTVRLSPFANPGLASAGTGDVLSGVIAGLVAQGLTLENAAACGVYLHGEAGEMVKENMGDAGMLSSDLLPALPLAIKRLKEIPAARVE